MARQLTGAHRGRIPGNLRAVGRYRFLIASIDPIDPHEPGSPQRRDQTLNLSFMATDEAVTVVVLSTTSQTAAAISAMEAPASRGAVSLERSINHIPKHTKRGLNEPPTTALRMGPHREPTSRPEPTESLPMRRNVLAEHPIPQSVRDHRTPPGTAQLQDALRGRLDRISKPRQELGPGLAGSVHQVARTTAREPLRRHRPALATRDPPKLAGTAQRRERRDRRPHRRQTPPIKSGRGRSSTASRSRRVRTLTCRGAWLDRVNKSRAPRASRTCTPRWWMVPAWSRTTAVVASIDRPGRGTAGLIGRVDTWLSTACPVAWREPSREGYQRSALRRAGAGEHRRTTGNGALRSRSSSA